MRNPGLNRQADDRARSHSGEQSSCPVRSANYVAWSHFSCPRPFPIDIVSSGPPATATGASRLVARVIQALSVTTANMLDPRSSVRTNQMTESGTPRIPLIAHSGREPIRDLSLLSGTGSCARHRQCEGKDQRVPIAANARRKGEAWWWAKRSAQSQHWAWAWHCLAARLRRPPPLLGPNRSSPRPRRRRPPGLQVPTSCRVRVHDRSRHR